MELVDDCCLFVCCCFLFTCDLLLLIGAIGQAWHPSTSVMLLSAIKRHVHIASNNIAGIEI